MTGLPASLAAYAGQDDPALPLPVESWNPSACGTLDMHVARDGAWFHEGRPVARPALVRLFARLLRKDDDGYVLVTPVEKLAITVEDVPFIAVALTTSMTAGPDLTFRTNVGDVVTAGGDHPLRFETEGGFRPYVHVRGGLEARLTQGVARDLAALAEIRDGMAGIASGNSFFTIGPADQLFDPAS